jgi:hypothetical protein
MKSGSHFLPAKTAKLPPLNSFHLTVGSIFQTEF